MALEMRPEEHGRMRLGLSALMLQALVGNTPTMAHTAELIGQRSALATKYADALMAAQGVTAREDAGFPY